MGETGFLPGGENYVYGSLVLVIMANAVNTVFKDGLMNQSYLLVLFVCYCLILICIVTILSRLCVQKAKTRSKPAWRLQDPNQEDAEDECKTMFTHLIESRGIYDLIYKAGLAFLTAALVLELLSLFIYNNTTLKSEFDAAAIVVAVTGVCLLFLVCNVAAAPRSKPLKYAYQPFDEFIRVPMKVFIPKMFLHLASNLFNLGGIIYYQFSAIYGLVTINRMPAEQIKRFIDATELAEIHTVLFIAMIVANASGIFMIIGNLVIARDFVKQDLLLTFQKNWMWNMAAIEFLLPNIEVESLEQLRDAFLEKSQKEDLTAEEEKALRYIQKPLWKNKRPFLRQREEALRRANPEEPQPSTSRQGPQPREPQPSTSRQGPQPREPQPSTSRQGPQPREPQPSTSRQGPQPREPQPSTSRQGPQPREPQPSTSRQGPQPREPQPSTSRQGPQPREPQPSTSRQGPQPREPQPSTSRQGPQPEEPQPSTSRQGPQPEEPQPSSSTERPLRVR